MMYVLLHLDETRYDDPDRFDVLPQPPNPIIIPSAKPRVALLSGCTYRHPEGVAGKRKKGTERPPTALARPRANVLF